MSITISEELRQILSEDSTLKVLATLTPQGEVHSAVKQSVFADDEGNIVKEIDYQKKCLDNKCIVLSDGTMYDSDGNIVNDLEYTKSCEKHYCEILRDDTIYGVDGLITDKKNYNLYCEKHFCEHIDNVYFDKNGKIVDEYVYYDSCNPNAIENPQTGFKVPLLLIGLSLMGGIGIFIFVKKYKIFQKLK